MTKIESIFDSERSMRVPVKIPWDEVDRLVVNRLIEIRNLNQEKDMSFIDKTIKWFLDDEEFQKYVIEGKEIEY